MTENSDGARLGVRDVDCHVDTARNGGWKRRTPEEGRRFMTEELATSHPWRVSAGEAQNIESSLLEWIIRRPRGSGNSSYAMERSLEVAATQSTWTNARSRGLTDGELVSEPLRKRSVSARHPDRFADLTKPLESYSQACAPVHLSFTAHESLRQRIIGFFSAQ